jgi:hypothetical protein
MNAMRCRVLTVMSMNIPIQVLQDMKSCQQVNSYRCYWGAVCLQTIGNCFLIDMVSLPRTLESSTHCSLGKQNTVYSEHHMRPISTQYGKNAEVSDINVKDTCNNHYSLKRYLLHVIFDVQNICSYKCPCSGKQDVNLFTAFRTHKKSVPYRFYFVFIKQHHINPLKTKRYLFYIRTQCVPCRKHSPLRLKKSLLMFYKAKVAVCAEIRTKHINARWAPCRIF